MSEHSTEQQSIEIQQMGEVGDVEAVAEAPLTSLRFTISSPQHIEEFTAQARQLLPEGHAQPGQPIPLIIIAQLHTREIEELLLRIEDVAASTRNAAKLEAAAYCHYVDCETNAFGLHLNALTAGFLGGLEGSKKGLLVLFAGRLPAAQEEYLFYCEYLHSQSEIGLQFIAQQRYYIEHMLKMSKMGAQQAVELHLEFVSAQYFKLKWQSINLKSVAEGQKLHQLIQQSQQQVHLGFRWLLDYFNLQAAKIKDLLADISKEITDKLGQLNLDRRNCLPPELQDHPKAETGQQQPPAQHATRAPVPRATRAPPSTAAAVIVM